MEVENAGNIFSAGNVILKNENENINEFLSDFNAYASFSEILKSRTKS